MTALPERTGRAAAAPAARLLHRHVRGQWAAMRRLAAWSAVEALPTFASGLLLARAIDHGFLAGRPMTGLAWLAALGALYVVGAVATGRVYPWLAATVEPLRDSLVGEVVGAVLHRGASGTAGAGVSQVTEQAEAVRALLGSALRNVRQLLSAGIAALVGLALLSPRLALVTALSVAIGLGIFGAFIGLQVRRYRAVVLRAEEIGESAAAVVHGVRDVVACAAEDRASDTVGRVVDAQARALRAYARTRLVRVPVLAFGVHLPLLALLLLSPYLTEHQGFTTGEIAGAVAYLVTGLQPGVTVLVDAGGTLLLSLAVVLGRLSEICATGPAGRVLAAGPAPVAAGRFDIEARHVTFAYSPRAAPVIEDLSLDIPEGTHLAVIGPSGAGKSTLANLLTGLATPQRGRITLGGAPLDPVRTKSFITLIPQESYVFAATLRENLTYLCPHPAQARLDDAVHAVGLAETVDRLGGYDAEIPPGGATLSQGERQLITLARAYLSPAPIVVLDEATSHLHPAAEARAEQALADRGGTLIVIAHRISSAERAHLILLLDGSAHVLGTHDALLRRSPLYSELVGHWHT
ncbi:ABC transporter ATP-binding protein [Actinomadura sp. KC06]|uniref:ABC transporter ATP-binding protein n=1 Tax=Actinomadura sp. KC06 TaxID=2530369 RepID=UPI00104F69FE|nr:ABC transporter ATP-binding protein [Actinomadura sp. KC06]TDD38676.1 ABC transporter ATP-binding protein [Actinomadura sp. KC06]